ncbi:MAG: thioredoxin domain-containing protein [bacterium]
MRSGEQNGKSAGSGNRLKKEKSPYLLQHADNPVDWYAWGDEAFEEARAKDKPVFLSIGYSTCHWCHVMEHESFEDERVAELMNDAFVCVKVDREERPDIDQVYMTVCQMMTGSGGWPMTIIMTPDKVPFFAATYIPKENRFGRVGMLELVPRIKEIWQTRRDEVLKTAESVSGALAERSHRPEGDEPGEEAIGRAAAHLMATYDPEFGGFGGAPKFPTPHNLTLLLRRWKRTGDGVLLAAVENTLLKMRLGGVYDHLGFGFHRYSTDREWLVPHFEKMLYDQALLMIAYTEAYQATGKEIYARTAREIAAYVLRDMRSPEGGFYSAEDADSEGAEGKFYVWTEEELRKVLPGREGDLMVRALGVRPEGNFTDEATGVKSAANILHMERPTGRPVGEAADATAGEAPSELARELAGELDMEPGEFAAAFERAREKLFRHREKRIHPYKDDKILTDWNGLMIAALARAGSVLDRPEYVEAARRASEFILFQMRLSGGRLLHRYRDGEAGIKGNLDDYAFVVWGLIELYQAEFDAAHLEAALELTGTMLEHFGDPSGGGLYFTPDDGEELLMRRKEAYDGAVPSGNSVAMLNLLRLARLTGRPDLEQQASTVSRAFSGSVSQSPAGHTQFLSAVDFAVGPAFEVVIAGRAGGDDTRTMLGSLRAGYIPNCVVLLRPAGISGDEAHPETDDVMITSIAEFTRPLTGMDGRATAYVCRNFACELPTTDAGTMLDLLGAERHSR